MKYRLIELINKIQYLIGIILFPITLLHSYFLNYVFLTIKTFIIIPYYNSLLSIKCKKFGYNVNFKYIDAKIIGHQYIEFGDNVLIGKSLRLEAIKLNEINNNPKIIIGKNVQINDFCHFGSCQLIEIKDGCLIASRVFITDHFHGKNDLKSVELPPLNREIFIKGSVIINENCWIGESVSIMPNVILGKNCIVGSNSVVTKSFPDNVIIAGNPAKIIRHIV